MSVSGHFCPEMPFYSKLMHRMKEQLAALSFAGCRKPFFDTLTRWHDYMPAGFCDHVVQPRVRHAQAAAGCSSGHQ